MQEEKVKALEALVEEAKELREAERDHLAEKSLDELGEMEVRRQLLTLSRCPATAQRIASEVLHTHLTP